PPGVHADDARMVEDRGRPGLPAESVDEAPIAGEMGMEHLDRDLPAQDRVVRPEHLSHASGGDAGDDLVATVDGGLDHGQGIRHLSGRRRILWPIVWAT